MFIIFLIFNEFQKVEKYLSLFAATEYLSVFMLRAVFVYTTSSKVSYIAPACVEKYTVLENDSYTVTCCRNDKVSALYHMKIH